MKNISFAILAAGTLTPAAIVFLDKLLGLSGRLMNSLDWLTVAFSICILGLIVWMICYRADVSRRTFGIVSIIIAVLSIFASSPMVIK